MTEPSFSTAPGAAGAAGSPGSGRGDEQALLAELAAVDELALGILHELATQTANGGMSLPRLGKRLGQGASVLLRQLSAMGDARVAGLPGPGWARVERQEDRWMAFITEAGRAQCRQWMDVLARAQALEAARGQPAGSRLDPLARPSGLAQSPGSKKGAETAR